MKPMPIEGRPGWTRYEPEPGEPLSAEAQANIEEFLGNPDRKIDTSDIPEVTDGEWRNAVRGRFYRPIKEAVSMRLDSDVVAWLKKDGAGYQTRANKLLRELMMRDLVGQ